MVEAIVVTGVPGLRQWPIKQRITSTYIINALVTCLNVRYH